MKIDEVRKYFFCSEACKREFQADPEELVEMEA
jgi:YHS domain-containing protein